MTYPYRLVASDGEVLASGKSIEDVEKIRQDKIKNFKSQIKLNAKEIEIYRKGVGLAGNKKFRFPKWYTECRSMYGDMIPSHGYTTKELGLWIPKEETE